jgi:hypothetical protein
MDILSSTVDTQCDMSGQDYGVEGNTICVEGLEHNDTSETPCVNHRSAASKDYRAWQLLH